MYADEARDAGVFAGTTADEITTLAHDVHRAVAGRMFGLLGRPARPVQVIHDAIATLAYTSTKFGVRHGPRVAGAVAAAARNGATDSVHDHAPARVVLNAVNGFVGDRVVEQSPALATALRLRTHTGPLREHAHNLVHDLGSVEGDDGVATGRVVIFLHGLMENDLSWHVGARRNWGERGITYGSLLARDAGWTPLYASMNTGLRISANGVALSRLLDDLVAQWPVPVTEIAFVGHSMGGLLARSAAHHGQEHDLAWVLQLRHIVGLGAPHLGAPLEQWVNRGMRLLDRTPETRPFATFFNQRSVGIKDLRHGAVLESDWHGHDPDDPADHCGPGVLLPGVEYYTVSATLSRRPRGIFAHDLLVTHRSASGQHETRRLAFTPEHSLHVGRKHHFDLLDHPLVHSQLRRWLA